MERFLERHRVAVLCGLSLVYFAGTALRARGRPFWFDELLTQFVARQPTLADTLKAAPVVDAMPPFTHATSHIVAKLFGTGEIAGRLPGMVGFWVFCLCLYRFVARRLGAAWGIVALLLPFSTASYGFSFENRCYGVLLGFGGAALLCWQLAISEARRKLALAGLALSIGGALLNHYFAVLLYIPLAGATLWRDWRRRTLDWPVWIALAAGILPIFAMLPALRRASHENGLPWAVAHVRDYLDFFQGEFQFATTFALLGAGLLLIWFVFGRPEAVRESPRLPFVEDHELLAGLLFLMIPVAAITIALVVPPHLFVDRYAVLSIAGLALIVPLLTARVAGTRAGMGAILAVAAFVPFAGELAQARPFSNPFDQEPLLKEALKAGPVAVNDGVFFLEWWYYAPPELKNRMFYVADRASAAKFVHTDTIDLNLLGLAKVWPVPVVSYDDFVTPGKDFVVYVSLGTGWLPQKILAAGGQVQPLKWSGQRALMRVRVP